MEHKILVAIDGSVHSKNILRYLSRLFVNQGNISFELIHFVFLGSLPPGNELLDEKEVLNIVTPKVKKSIKTAENTLLNSSRQLIRSGIASERCTSRVKICRSNIAANIVNEGRIGYYDAVVIGRRGLSKLEKFILGSVSKEILQKNHSTPLWIIDGKINSKKILVPVDGSPETLQAVDHLAFMVANNHDLEITLFHSTALLAQRHDLLQDECERFLGKESCDLLIAGDESYLQAPKKILVDSGFPAERIKQLETSKGLYPSRQIVRQALIDEFGTIVMGRRALTKEKGLWGSVSEKVLAMSENLGIWIVG